MISFPVFPNVAMAKAMGYEACAERPTVVWKREGAGYVMAVVLPVKDDRADRG